MSNDPYVHIILNRRQRQRARQGKGQTFIRVAGIALIAIVISCGLFFTLTVGGAVAAYLSLTADLPDPSQIEAQFTNQNQDFFETTKIYDRTGKNLLYEVIDERTGDRQWVALDQIPELCRQATIANEDRSFYENPGFDLRGMGRALMSNLQGGQVQGGSSITQQVVKNTLIELTYIVLYGVRQALADAAEVVLQDNDIFRKSAREAGGEESGIGADGG